MSQFTIAITNHSGATQAYNIVAATPPVSSLASDIKAHIYRRAASVGQGQTAQFILNKKYYAVTGTLPDSSGVSVTSTRPVALGTRDASGQISPGTTLDLVVVDKVPLFKDEPAEPLGRDDAFLVRTGTDFLRQDAQDGTSPCLQGKCFT